MQLEKYVEIISIKFVSYYNKENYNLIREENFEEITCIYRNFFWEFERILYIITVYSMEW